ncbi:MULTISPECIES: VanW family protein [Actinokineospora]|uniref:Vanomycin resistance protein VanB n=1 Tax=Actinokineospora fastidiosa TaxID=1816 RepID=A0A918G7S4_9PSEU|nr:MULTISPECIES: VanW family protein [Actinokineospora]UVS82588.1 putative vancomycin resistance protein [Actinokineospora sp. UTMC 2448]GGS19998.1 vanomycin resistance protein VanB [Actinokineospora fastidiosa]
MQDRHRPGHHQWPVSHAEQTDLLPVVGADAATQRITPVGEPKKRNLRKPALIAGAVFGALVLLYGIDLLVSGGSVPRGVTVAGVDVGGMSREDAEAALRQEIEPRLSEPIALQAGTVEHKLDPAAAGLTLDWTATLEQAGDQPLNPFTRIGSFFSTREVGVVTATDDAKLDAAMEKLVADTAKDPVEGAITFSGAQPVPVDPIPGQELKVDGARETIVDGWASGRKLDLPVEHTPVKTTPEGVAAALEQVAKPAVSGPVVVKGEGKNATIKPEVIAGALTFAPADGGGLTPKLDLKKITDAVKPQLAETEQEGKDAEIVFEGGKPTVTPSVEGRGIKYDVAFAKLLDVLKKTEGREITVEYAKTPAKVTTEEAKNLGIKEVIGEFTTRNFAADSGVNIRVVAGEVDGAIVKPGETFSLNGHTGPRTEAQGYVGAGIIQDGAPGRAVGGGISQFATTLYNAAYFAGMVDAGHQEHSYYISRYPAAREATVFQNADGSSVIDLRFTNDAETGVAIQTIWTPSSITVRLWGTKRYIVESVTGPRTNETPPSEKEGPKENCKASNGAPGFTVTDTRIIKSLSGAEIRRDTRTVRYNPQPKIVCPPQN